MTVEFITAEGYPDNDTIELICRIGSDESLFPTEVFEQKLKHQQRIFGCYAYDKKVLVAYKIGYEPRPRYFESWMGAVAPEYRCQGIARQLMTEQHNWCAEQGYRIITTVTDASNNTMLILNLKADFVISGTLLDRGENYQVLLQKLIENQEGV